MNWNQLPPITLQPWFSTKLKKACQILNGRIEALLAERQVYEANLAAMKGQDPAAWSDGEYANAVAKHDELKANLFRLLHDELAIRKDLAAIEAPYRDELVKAVARATEDAQAAEEDLRQKLVAIGYRDVPVTDPEPCKITPEMFHRNTVVRAARTWVQELANRLNDRSAWRANEEAAAAIAARLQQAGSRLTNPGL